MRWKGVYWWLDKCLSTAINAVTFSFERTGLHQEITSILFFFHLLSKQMYLRKKNRLVIVFLMPWISLITLSCLSFSLKCSSRAQNFKERDNRWLKSKISWSDPLDLSFLYCLCGHLGLKDRPHNKEKKKSQEADKRLSPAPRILSRKNRILD